MEVKLRYKNLTIHADVWWNPQPEIQIEASLEGDWDAGQSVIDAMTEPERKQLLDRIVDCALCNAETR